MNILLTGSGGFIGRHLAAYLSDNPDIILYAPRSRELNLLDCASVKEYFQARCIDLIIHSASCGVRIVPDAAMGIADDNIAMFDNLSHAMSKSCHMIVLGSGAEYDKTRSLQKVTESEFGNYVPQDPYGYSKYVISKKIESTDNILNLRLFGVYGEYEHPSRFISYAIMQNLKRTPIVINQNVVFDFIYIQDLLRIVDYFIHNQLTVKFINLTPSESICISKIAETVNQIGVYSSEIIIKTPGLNNEYTGSNATLLDIIGDFVFTDYASGIRRLYECFLNRDLIAY